VALIQDTSPLLTERNLGDNIRQYSGYGNNGNNHFDRRPPLLTAISGVLGVVDIISAHSPPPTQR